MYSSSFSYLLNVLFPRPVNPQDIPVSPKVINNTHIIYSYSHPDVKTLIRYLKQTNDSDLARYLALQMVHHLLPLITKFRTHGYYLTPLIIPVPLSKASRVKRGFNQVAKLSRYLAEYLQGEIMDSSTIKKRKTKKQALLPKSQRRINVQHCFQVIDPNLLINADVIIIDDLITTGATIESLTSVLKKAGARNIISSVIAH